MNWNKYSPDTILTGRNKEGVRLIIEFGKDFKNKMGYDLDIGCIKCFRNDFQKFLNRGTMAERKSAYKLKPMYNGLSLGFGSKVYISDQNITDELAERFVKEHPKGLSLFSEYPKQEEPKADKPKQKRSRKKVNG
tara:strand:+ start:29 stop:433 length:405 start_codon:yes stop_codon:yes gene_type:complete